MAWHIHPSTTAERRGSLRAPALVQVGLRWDLLGAAELREALRRASGGLPATGGAVTRVLGTATLGHPGHSMGNWVDSQLHGGECQYNAMVQEPHQWMVTC
eukprot:Skav222034  [mRNA]  locus=scaffold1020:146955:147257:- [translate_table: standard]